MRAKDNYGFTAMELLLSLCIIFVASHHFIGNILPFPYRMVVPYGSLPLLGALLLATYFTEAAKLQLVERGAGRWKAMGANIVCTFLGFLFAGLLYVLARRTLGAAAMLSLTSEIVLLQMGVILILPFGLRFLWEKHRQHKESCENPMVLMLLPQLVPPFLILFPVAFMGFGSLLLKTSFLPNCQFTKNKAVVIYFVDSENLIRRATLGLHQQPSVVNGTLSPQEILMFGDAPNYPLAAYDINSRKRRRIECADCNFTSASVEAYLRRGRSKDWLNVYRFGGMHGESWRPVDMDPENKYRVGIGVRYYGGNIEALWADSDLESTKSRVVLRAQLPTMEWAWRYVYILPGGEVLAQLGDNIVLLDLDTMKLGFFARGSRPVVTSLEG